MSSLKLTNGDIKRFQALYAKHFKQVLTNDEARDELSLLVRQMEIVYQPISTAQLDRHVMQYVDEDVNHGEAKIL